MCPGIIFRSGCGSWTFWLQTWSETSSDPFLETSSTCHETLSGTWSEYETYGTPSVGWTLTWILSETCRGRRHHRLPCPLQRS